MFSGRALPPIAIASGGPAKRGLDRASDPDVKARVIVNPTAGRGAALERLPDINEHLRRRFGIVNIAMTVASGDAETLAERAGDDGCTHVFAAGGDGTLNEVINGIRKSGRLDETVFGILPFGTGNDFARALGVRGDGNRALETLTSGRVVSVDLGSLNGRLFVNASAGGFIAEVSDAASSGLKTVAGRFAYFIAGGALLLDYEPSTARLTPTHGSLGDARLHMFVVSNGRTIGGGHQVAPRADILDGLLDVCLVHSTSAAEFIALLPRISAGKHLEDEHVVYEQVSAVDLEFDRVMKVNTDGEVLETSRCSYKVLRSAARFLLPPSDDAR